MKTENLPAELRTLAVRAQYDARAQEMLSDAAQHIENLENAAARARIYAGDLLAGLFNKLLHHPNIEFKGNSVMQIQRYIREEIEKAPVLHERPADDGVTCANAAHEAWVTEVTDFLERCHYVPGYMSRPVALETASRLFGGRHG